MAYIIKQNISATFVNEHSLTCKKSKRTSWVLRRHLSIIRRRQQRRRHQTGVGRRLTGIFRRTAGCSHRCGVLRVQEVLRVCGDDLRLRGGLRRRRTVEHRRSRERRRYGSARQAGGGEDERGAAEGRTGDGGRAQRGLLLVHQSLEVVRRGGSEEASLVEF